MKPYMQIDKSNSPICKLGWANSPACDSFQLGESVRWLCRRKLTTPNLNMIFATPDGDMAIPEGSPRAMIKILKEFPDYQIDANHRRCGIKGKLIQLLDVVDRMIVRPQQVGLCLDCWYSHEHDYFSWSMEHRPDPAPYKGNIVIDLAAVQSFKDTMKRQQDQVQHDSRQESFESDSTSSLSSTVADSIRTDLHVDTQARLSARISNGRTILYHNFIRPPSLKAHQILQKPGSSNLQCPFVCDHELYAKVFSPEKW